MSNQAQGLVRGLDLKAPLKPILMAYAAYADEIGYVWAGVDTIAWDTGYGETTVKDARKELIREGWMASKRRFGTSALSRLNLEQMTSEQVDRGEARMIHPELEFEPGIRRSTPKSRQATVRKTPGQSRTAATRLNVVPEQPPGGSTNSRQAAVGIAATRPLSVSESSDDPSVEARAGAGRHRRDPAPDGAREGNSPASNPTPGLPPAGGTPTLSALTLVSGLEFGAHRRPTRRQAERLAALVDAAVAGGLSLSEVRRHAQATVNAAKPPGEKGNAVRYLLNGLEPERLPVPAPGGAGPVRSVTLTPAEPDSPARRAAVASVRSLPARPAAKRVMRAQTYRQAGVLDG